MPKRHKYWILLVSIPQRFIRSDSQKGALDNAARSSAASGSEMPRASSYTVFLPKVIPHFFNSMPKECRTTLCTKGPADFNDTSFCIISWDIRAQVSPYCPFGFRWRRAISRTRRFSPSLQSGACCPVGGGSGTGGWASSWLERCVRSAFDLYRST